jgi:hypothetical protein
MIPNYFGADTKIGVATLNQFQILYQDKIGELQEKSKSSNFAFLR